MTVRITGAVLACMLTSSPLANDYDVSPKTDDSAEMKALESAAGAEYAYLQESDNDFFRAAEEVDLYSSEPADQADDLPIDEDPIVADLPDSH